MYFWRNVDLRHNIYIEHTCMSANCIHVVTFTADLHLVLELFAGSGEAGAVGSAVVGLPNTRQLPVGALQLQDNNDNVSTFTLL